MQRPSILLHQMSNVLSTNFTFICILLKKKQILQHRILIMLLFIYCVDKGCAKIKYGLVIRYEYL